MYQQSLQLNAISGRTMQQHHDAKSYLAGISCSQSVAQSALSVAMAEFLQLCKYDDRWPQISIKSINLIEERIDLTIRITNQLELTIAKPLSTCHSSNLCFPKVFNGKKCLNLKTWCCPDVLHITFGLAFGVLKTRGNATVLVGGRVERTNESVTARGALNGAGLPLNLIPSQVFSKW
ncbi:hypothetical protein [Providencia hangzhouensis]|uniref:hypothetical protein n=1 Tax=Providencia hangzhouensis TaxID=3031799 RepID=UPI0034DD9922